ncbi:transposase [Rhodococcus sp. BGS-1C]|uniref:integrase core domain-containing protein n=1 Tax=unclassified Rhodococcus (in: high G+C Gram-positive bacteria) TaxID=192944 RepID=UPI0019D053A5
MLYPAGAPWNNGHIESFNNRIRKECLNRNYWTSLLEARVVIEDFKDDHNHRHRHSSLGYLTPSWGPSRLRGRTLRDAATPTNRWTAARSTDINQNRLQNDVVRLWGTCHSKSDALSTDCA